MLNTAGYAKADPTDFDRERALDPTVFIRFVKETQPETWESLETLHGSDSEDDRADPFHEQRPVAEPSTENGTLSHYKRLFTAWVLTQVIIPS